MIPLPEVTACQVPKMAVTVHQPTVLRGDEPVATEPYELAIPASHSERPRRDAVGQRPGEFLVVYGDAAYDADAPMPDLPDDFELLATVRVPPRATCIMNHNIERTP